MHKSFQVFITAFVLFALFQINIASIERMSLMFGRFQVVQGGIDHSFQVLQRISLLTLLVQVRVVVETYSTAAFSRFMAQILLARVQTTI